MKDIVQLFKDAIRKNRERGHDTLYVAVDVHGTIFRPSRKTTMRFDKKSKEMTECVGLCGLTTDYEFYPFARQVLQRMSDNPKVKLILWTSAMNVAELYDELKQADILVDNLNHNPDFQFNSYADFSSKFYFDILLDDKAGFDAETDWERLVDNEEIWKGLKDRNDREEA